MDKKKLTSLSLGDYYEFRAKFLSTQEYSLHHQITDVTNKFFVNNAPLFLWILQYKLVSIYEYFCLQKPNFSIENLRLQKDLLDSLISLAELSHLKNDNDQEVQKLINSINLKLSDLKPSFELLFNESV